MIPEMTDPLGKHWEQPRTIREAPMDDDHVLLTKAQFDRLHEYSSTLPTGVYPGKCWKRKEDRWLLVWYGLTPDPTQCSIEFREILLV
jgi:hypothetical protein